MSIAPDLPGFVDAQKRLREGFGEEVTFLGPLVATYPPGTAIDPETQLPYDPVVAADTSSRTETVVRCNVVFKAVNRAGISGEAQAIALGWMETGDMMLIADISDKANIDGRERFLVRDEEWDIHATLEDGVGGVQRYLVFGRKR